MPMPSVEYTQNTYMTDTLTGGLDSKEEDYHMNVEEVLLEAPRDQLVAALSSLADLRDLEWSKENSLQPHKVESSEGKQGGRGGTHIQRKSGFPNVFRALLSALTSPLFILKFIIRRFSSSN